MKAIVTAVSRDGAKKGWPGASVFRYRGEDGSWAWVPQPSSKQHHDVGDIIDVEGGWDWEGDGGASWQAAIDKVDMRDRLKVLRSVAKTMDNLRWTPS